MYIRIAVDVADTRKDAGVSHVSAHKIALIAAEEVVHIRLGRNAVLNGVRHAVERE